MLRLKWYSTFNKYGSLLKHPLTKSILPSVSSQMNFCTKGIDEENPTHHDRYHYDMDIEHPHLKAKPRNLPLPEKAKVVICGGGVIGSSIAYHLAKLGWQDILLLEQGHLTCGTTWHSVGLIGTIRGTSVESYMAKYSAELYEKLENTGYGTGWKKCGSLNMARTKERFIYYKRKLDEFKPLGITGKMLNPSEIKDMVGHIRVDDLEGALWVPDDGVVTAPDACDSMAIRAAELGVQIVEKCKVMQVLAKEKKVSGVVTDKGTVACDFFVNSGGQWAREIGMLSEPNVNVPLHSCEHFYIITRPMDGIDRMMPVIRDYDGYVYVREWGGGIIGGGFEPQGKPCFNKGIPEKFEFQLLPEDWDHFVILQEEMLHRIPKLADAEVRQLTNGPESFTPDGKCILGEAPEIENYFVAAGMNSGGIVMAGGVGKVLSEWIAQGEPPVDCWALDIKRFTHMHSNKMFLKERVREILGMHSKVGPEITFKSGRNLRISPLFSELQNYGAWFGQTAGYETPLWFDDVDRDDSKQEGLTKPTYGKPHWFDKVRTEYWACKKAVGVTDMTMLSKFDLRSPGGEVVKFLQYLCSSDIGKEVGSIIHTGMQNHNGGFENDCTLARLANNRYFMTSSLAQQTRAFKWMENHLPSDGSVQLRDVTSAYTAINVIGPKTEAMLSELTDIPLSKGEFPPMTCRLMDVGQISNIKTMRLSHSEDGWMLYIPSEFALHVYKSLMSAGRNYGLWNAGHLALKTLRAENCLTDWGHELTPFTTPLECKFEVNLDKMEDFIGKEALINQSKEGTKKRLVQFLLDGHDVDHDLWPWGGEPIYRNDKYAGLTTSAAFGFSLGHHVCLGFVQDFDEASGETKVINEDFILENAKYEIEIVGKRYPAKVNI